MPPEETADRLLGRGRPVWLRTDFRDETALLDFLVGRISEREWLEILLEKFRF